MKMTTWMMEDSTAPHMNVATAIPATAPAPHQYNSYSSTVRYSDRIIKFLLRFTAKIFIPEPFRKQSTYMHFQ